MQTIENPFDSALALNTGDVMDPKTGRINVMVASIARSIDKPKMLPIPSRSVIAAGSRPIAAAGTAAAQEQSSVAIMGGICMVVLSGLVILSFRRSLAGSIRKGGVARQLGQYAFSSRTAVNLKARPAPATNTERRRARGPKQTGSPATHSYAAVEPPRRKACGVACVHAASAATARVPLCMHIRTSQSVEVRATRSAVGLLSSGRLIMSHLS
jgi:hypothetical protein